MSSKPITADADHVAITLDRWSLRDFDVGQGLTQAASTTGDETWIPVPAPGDVYQALITAGRLPHPFEGRHEADAAWVRDREWWWRTTFVAPTTTVSEMVELVFEGLDTFAEIYLDGVSLGRGDNMFRRYVFDPGDRLRPGETHILAIRFDPPAQAVVDRPLPVWGAFTDRVSRSKRNLMRKAQFGWGWDWGPDLPTVGIWRPAYVTARPRPRLADVRFTTVNASAERADCLVAVAVSDTSGRSLAIELDLADPGGRSVFSHRREAGDTSPIAIAVDRPRLWWTADLGEQPLYTLVVRLLEGDRLADEIRHEVGLRTVALDQSPDPDEPGTTFFRFILNGVPLFARGACWVPTTSFVADVEAEPYDRLIDQAVRANMNMIRVWGGGIYEPDIFYDLCDRRGLLVWQDFMFACAHYPEDPDFAASVQAEVEDQVRRLRNHPCLALWCGNNESQAMHRINADISGDPASLSGMTLYDGVIPEVLDRLDPETPYWPGSPSGGPNPNSMKAGDVHDWTVWHGVPPIPDADMTEPFASTPEGVAYTRYAEDSARFVSEFGIQAAPAMATLARWMDVDDLRPDSEGFLARIKDEARKADAMMIPVTGLPTTLQDYVDFTQWTQAEGLKFGIEHFRRRKPHCSGALLWQFNDCWPCVSWSLVDYDGVEKAGYHAVRRAFAPVLASFRTLGADRVELWITNDTRDAVAGIAEIELAHLDGRPVWRERIAFSVGSTRSEPIWQGDVATAADIVLSVRSAENRFLPNRALRAPISELTLEHGVGPRVQIRQVSPHALQVDLSADAWLAFVHLVSDRSDLRFSDNHFDMAAGDARTVTVTATANVGPDDITVRCWNNREQSGDAA